MTKNIKYSLIILWFSLVSLFYYKLYPVKDILLGFPKITAFGITGALLSHLLILSFYVISASGWGRIFWYQHHLQYFEKLIFSCGCGLGILSIIILLANFAGITSNTFYFIVLLIGFIIFLTAADKVHEHFISGLKPWMLILFIPALSSLIGALAPPTQYDSLVYHLTLAKKYLEHGGIYQITENIFYSFPQNMEMLFQSAISIDSDILANLISWAFLLLTGSAIYTFSKRYFNKNIGILSAVIWFFTPTTLFLGTGTYVDLALAFFVFLSFYNLMIYFESDHNFWIYSAGVFAGIALGVKYTAVIPVFLLGGFILLRSEDKIKGLKSTFKFLLVCLLVFAPWLVKNIIFLKNPVAPWASAFFSGSLIDSKAALQYFNHIAGHGLAVNGFMDLIKTPWKLTAYGFNYGGGFDILGPIFLLFIPVLFLNYKIDKIEVTVFIFTLCYSFVWLFSGKVLRFLVPLLPFLCLLSGISIFKLAESKVLKTAAYLFLVTALLHNILLFHWVMGAIDPYSVVIGNENKKHYLARKLNSYQAISEAVNNLPESSKILSWGETRAYYFLKENITPTYFDEHPLIKWLIFSKDSSALAACLKGDKVTHILVNNFELRRLGFENKLSDKQKEVFEDFKKNLCSLIYEDKYCQVYKFAL